MKYFLLVVDVQKGFLVNGANSEAIDRIDSLLHSKVFDCVIATIYQNYENSPIIRLMGWDKLLTAEEQALIGKTAVCTNYIVYKDTYSAYSESLVDLLKRENGGEVPECVFVVGVDTDCCVLMTATDLFEAGIRPVVLTRYCGASGGREAHEAGIRSMVSLVGRNNLCDEVIDSREALAKALERSENTDLPPIESVEEKAVRLVEKLTALGWRITFAESCTGGMAASTLVNVASASSVFDASFVTYANDAKIKYLGVHPESIEVHGVVSETVALEMAVGAAKANNSNVAIGISGIAGPTGARPGKPVGMVCFGFYINGHTFSETKQFGQIGRNLVREKSVDFVFNTLLDRLSEI